ncbi:MAG TPA: two-component system sensor histidine kinase RcsC [Arsenophonus sp.]
MSSFRASLKISRYLFRTLGVMLWVMGAVITLFYLFNIFNEVKSDIRQQYYSTYDSMVDYVRHTDKILRSIQYMVDSHIEKLVLDPNYKPVLPKQLNINYLPLIADANCNKLRETSQKYLLAFDQLFSFWRNNLVPPQGLKTVFIVGPESKCMIDLTIRNSTTSVETLKKIIHENMCTYMSLRAQGREQNIYWITPATGTDNGSFYVLAPIYVKDTLFGLIGLERSIRLEQFNLRYDRPISTFVLDANNRLILHFPNDSDLRSDDYVYQLEPQYFGYDNDFSRLILKERLLPSLLSVVFSIPISNILNEFKLSIINGILLNIISFILITFLIWLLERKMLLLAENNAIRLEEHEQFNHKIVASAPVGIIILRLVDGVNILSNELAHDYFRLLSHDDKSRILSIIQDKSSSYIDVVTTSHTHLQISYVISRYQNKEVAICVLVDISARVQMEKSLHNMAQASEQANQAKSMFLATVSHELRTPLYGIIGNLELLQSYELPMQADRLLTTMDHSSSLLLKIINDILDFSKIESKQLNIDPAPFNCREVISLIISNYIPLIGKKGLSIYYYIAPNVPDIINADSVRVQQIISNILSNAIKFTKTGFILLNVFIRDFYICIEIRDTGIGIPDNILMQLFDPFFQIKVNNESFSQGTGLGLPICEKLINLMDGDIEVNSQVGIGSSFTVRLPLFDSEYITCQQPEYRQNFRIGLYFFNHYLRDYLQTYLNYNGFNIIIVWDEHSKDQIYDLIITDYEGLKSECKFMLRLFSTFIGEPLEYSKNDWVHNTYQLDKLDSFIDQLVMDNCEQQVVNQSPVISQADKKLCCLTVLIVDDHPINRSLLADQLKSIGFNIALAEDGLIALDYVRQKNIDIVLTDVNMPNLDGYGLAKLIREEGYSIPIVALTANAMADEKQRCLSVGMNDCLSKPVTLKKLKQLLLKCCDANILAMQEDNN